MISGLKVFDSVPARAVPAASKSSTDHADPNILRVITLITLNCSLLYHLLTLFFLFEFFNLRLKQLCLYVAYSALISHIRPPKILSWFVLLWRVLWLGITVDTNDTFMEDFRSLA